MEHRTCSKCGLTKSANEFSRLGEGRHSHCKACRLKDERLRLRKRGGSPDRREYSRTHYHANSEAAKARTRETRTRHPLKYAAQKAITAGLKAGRIVREPCLFCDAVKVEAHHHDYSQPLAVTWLCRRHHKLVHREVDEP